MWTKQSDGSVIWSEDAKLTLISLLKRNPEALKGIERLNPKKAPAWKRVYDELIRAGMPRISIDRVKKCWSRIQNTAKNQHTEHMKVYNSKGKLVPLSKLNQATINLLNAVNNGVNIMPKPKIVVKKEPIDEPYMENNECAADNEYSEQIEEDKSKDLAGKDMNPIVRLTRINIDENKDTRSNSTKASELSLEYWALMKKVAESELKLKLAQHKYEEEKMEMERAIFHKNMTLADYKIKVQEMQIDALGAQNNF